MARITSISAVAAAAVGLGVGGWAGAAALQPAAEPASAGRVLQVRFETRREPPYVPPPVEDATRLDVLSTAPSTEVDDGVLSARSADVVRAIAAEEDRRAADARALQRAEDARYERESREGFADVDADHPAYDG